MKIRSRILGRERERVLRESRTGEAPTRRRRYGLTATWGVCPTRNVYDRCTPAPKLNDKVGILFTWTKQMTSWADSNTCEGAFKETDNRTVIQGPNAKSKEELGCQCGREIVALARTAYKGITTAVSNSFLLRKIYEIGNPSLTMAEPAAHMSPATTWTSRHICVDISTRGWPMGRHLPFAL